MDHYRRSQRNHCFDSPKRKQRSSASVQGSALNQAKKGLTPPDGKLFFTFSTRSSFSRLQQKIERRKNEALTRHRINTAVEQYQKTMPSAENKPVFSETLEGETPLGGPMNLSAPWYKPKE